MKNIRTIIKNISKYNQRQLENENKTADYLQREFAKSKIGFKIQNFKNNIPVGTCSLKVDGEKLKCENTGFRSGEIKNNENIISSELEDNVKNADNINFNPRSNSISLTTFYQSCAIAVSKKYLKKIQSAKKIKGATKVQKRGFVSRNILVGNLENPQNLLFCHYDSIKKGVIDNACSVALLLHLIKEEEGVLDENLFIFAGSEELSYDKPVYWGRGYRVFESKYWNLMKKAKEIIVVDGVGNGKTSLIKKDSLLYQAFPVKNLSKIKKKSTVISGDFDRLMKYYHSEDDNLKKFKVKHLKEAKSILLNMIS